MDKVVALEVIGREGAALASTPADMLDRQVPGCPDWNVAALIGHTGWVYKMVATVLGTGAVERPDFKAIGRPPEGAAAVPFFEESWAAVTAALAGIEPGGDPVWTFTGPQERSWWLRRMAQESAIHRWDAESAYTDPTPIGGDLAVDGIDEALEVYFPNRFAHDQFAPGTSLHLHATDHPDGEWFVSFGGTAEAFAWERGHRKGDVALRGPVSDLLLWVYSRRRSADLDSAGDAALAERFQAAANF